MRIAVTGGNGKLGAEVVRTLEAEGHFVITLDVVGTRGATFSRVDLTDYGQVVDSLFSIDDRHDGLDAVVHLAALPAGGLAPDSATFANNMLSTFNVFHGARRAGIKRIVYASSETLLGIPFEIDPPYLPVDEEYPSRPESTYSVVKHLEEELAQKLVRWDPELSITALRFSNVMSADDYALFPGYQSDWTLRRWNLFGYIDTRDGAQAVSRALQTRGPGFEAYIIAAADTAMDAPSADLAADQFPAVQVTGDISGRTTLLSISKARRELGYDPQHSWRDHL